jgi:uncharacterized protein RhaS with RHS repeats
MQARYYDPLLARFYSNDPLGFRDIHSFNRYAYANNNPYKYIDPDGRSPSMGWRLKSVAKSVARIMGASSKKIKIVEARFTIQSEFSSKKALQEALNLVTSETTKKKKGSHRKGDFSQKTKNEIRKEQPNCQKCGVETVSGTLDTKGVSPAGDRSEIHHKEHVQNGGTGKKENGENLCHDCHVKEHQKLNSEN